MVIQKKLIFVIVSSLLSLIILDFLIGIFISGFEYDQGSNKIETYFSYGYSTEGKLKKLIGDADSSAANITKAGWYDTFPEPVPAENLQCETTVSIYGMSFTARITQQLRQISECYTTVDVAGPGAPLSHSITMFDQFKTVDTSDYIVVGILASALPKINTVAHLNSAFEYPGSHFYPRYTLLDGQLVSSGIPVNNLQEVRDTLADPVRRSELIEFFETNDEYFDRYVFEASWADSFNTLKMLRRSYAQANKREAVARYFDGRGFTNNDGMLDVSRAMLEKFIEDVRSVGKTPVIILLSDREYAQSLDSIFLPVLDDMDVKYVNSTDIIDSNDLASFESDGHFTPENDRQLAYALHRLLSE